MQFIAAHGTNNNITYTYIYFDAHFRSTIHIIIMTSGFAYMSSCNVARCMYVKTCFACTQQVSVHLVFNEGLFCVVFAVLQRAYLPVSTFCSVTPLPSPLLQHKTHHMHYEITAVTNLLSRALPTHKQRKMCDFLLGIFVIWMKIRMIIFLIFKKFIMLYSSAIQYTNCKFRS